MGFIPDIERICKLLPITRQTLFFSATMPPEIQRITNQFLHNPVQIEASPRSSTASTIEQSLVLAPSYDADKREKLREVLRAEGEVTNAIIFANRKTTVSVLEKSLLKHKFNAGALHGDMDQFSRLKTLDAFRAGEISYLIASDVAARAVSTSLRSAMCSTMMCRCTRKTYVHRIGRTGRAGRAGSAITLVTLEEMRAVRGIEELIGKVDRLARRGTERRRRSPRPCRARAAGGAARRRPNPLHVHQAKADKPAKHKAAKKRAEEPAKRREDRQPEPAGFTQANMPAFLARPIESA